MASGMSLAPAKDLLISALAELSNHHIRMLPVTLLDHFKVTRVFQGAVPAFCSCCQTLPSCSGKCRVGGVQRGARTAHLDAAVHSEVPELGIGVELGQLRQRSEMGGKQGVGSQPYELL